jgi:adenine-specific DNA-methyltransferase
VHARACTYGPPAHALGAALAYHDRMSAPERSVVPRIAEPRALAALERALAIAAGTAGARGADADLERAQRRARGVFFTPAPLVEFVVARALCARLAGPDVGWSAGIPRLRVLDPCAGDGRFLVEAQRVLLDQAARLGHVPAPAALAAACLIGIERDPDFAALARARTGAVIHCREALCDAPDELLGQVDVIVGNPPYLRSIHLAASDPALWRALAGRYAATSHGEWDLYAAFLEQALAWLAPDGQAGLVVPSRWLTAAFAAPLRDLLARARAVRGIVDFGAQQIFAGATTYASVAFLGRAPAREVAVARRLGSGWRCGHVDAGALGRGPWIVTVGRRRRLLERLRAAAPALGQVARIAKGAGTNADPVYVIERAAIVDGAVVGTSKATGAVRVEAAACRPCLRGRDVRAWGQAGDDVQCIVPYQASGALWSADELAAMPLVATHLARCRPLLEARERGRFAGPRWYCFGRPQNLAFLCDPRPKIVIPDVAHDGRALVDARGALALDSAYAVRVFDERAGYTLPLLAAVLNAPVVRLWLRETGVPLRGSYVRLKTAYLQSLPLPPPGPDMRTATALATGLAAGQASDAGAAAALDEALRRAYGLDDEDWREAGPAGAPEGERATATPEQRSRSRARPSGEASPRPARE